MKLKFKKQEFQEKAVSAVADLFDGQNGIPSTFSVEKFDASYYGSVGDRLLYGNSLNLTTAQIQANLHAVQDRNGLPQTELTELRFNIEMETGTGKTFVYTKTIYELNKRYGFNKFVILVPSRAIKEGVNASLRATSSYFKEEYGKELKAFIYDSKKLTQVRNFALSPSLEVMIVTIDAINKDTNLFTRETEKMDKPARDYIADCRPIIISDEAHNYETEKRRKAIELLNPLFQLQYSATYKVRMNTVYKLTPVDAYQEGIVKQICVANDHMEDDFNKAYMRLIEVGNDGRFYAKIDLDIKQASGEIRKTVKVYTGDKLKSTTKNDKYDGFVISRIRLDDETIEFTNTQELKVGQAVGTVDDLEQSRSQIRRTIEAHLDKEKRELEKGIKVLSLFFIDEVAKYRDYEAEGGKGIYATMFEDAYNELINLPAYASLKARFRGNVSEYHDGYFSQDKKKKGQWSDTQGDTDADDSTYNTIMKDKERLLSFEDKGGSPLRFIWSHSALKEGWDNPNVFQICTLINTGTEFTCRQKIGRGLRLCVNQDGERIEDKKVNILTIIAKESFSDFAAKLQTEYEEVMGVKFGVLLEAMFVNIPYKEKVVEQKTIDKGEAKELVEFWTSSGMLEKWLSDPEMIEAEAKITARLESGELTEPPSPATEVMRQFKKGATKAQMAKAIEGITFTEETEVARTTSQADATEIVEHFRTKGYVDSRGGVQDTLKNDLKNGTLDLPARFETARERLTKMLKDTDRKVEVRQTRERVTVKRKDELFEDDRFKAIWNRIKQKSYYRINTRIDELMHRINHDIAEMTNIEKLAVFKETAKLIIDQKGVAAQKIDEQLAKEFSVSALPDIVRILSDATGMPRANIGRIITESGRIKDFINNPQKFIEQVQGIIDFHQRTMSIEGIVYTKIADAEYSLFEVFGDADEDETMAYLSNTVAVEKSLYSRVIFESGTESDFANDLEDDPNVEFFFKIPSGFKIDTPVGKYGPDWAVYYRIGDEIKMYFIIETKGIEIKSLTDRLNFRHTEDIKIYCGGKHFEGIGTDAKWRLAKAWDKVVRR